MEKKSSLSKLIRTSTKKKEEKKNVQSEQILKKKFNKENNFREIISDILNGQYMKNIISRQLIEKEINWENKSEDEKKIMLFNYHIKKLEKWERDFFKKKFEFLPKNMVLKFMKYYINEDINLLYRDVLNNWMDTPEVKKITEQYENVLGKIYNFETLDNIGKKGLLELADKIEIKYPKSYKTEFEQNLSPSLLNYHALLYQISRSNIEPKLKEFKSSLNNIQPAILIDKFNKLNKLSVDKKETNRGKIIKYIYDYNIKEKIIPRILIMKDEYKRKIENNKEETIKGFYYKILPEKKELLDKCVKCKEFMVRNNVDKGISKIELQKLSIKNQDINIEECYKLIFEDKCDKNIIDKTNMVFEILNVYSEKLKVKILEPSKQRLMEQIEKYDKKTLEEKYNKIKEKEKEKKSDENDKIDIQKILNFFIELKKEKLISTEIEKLNKIGIQKLRDIAVTNNVDTKENINKMLYYDIIKQILKKQKKDLKEIKLDKLVVTDPFYGLSSSSTKGLVINKKPSVLSDNELNRILKKYNYENLNISRKEKIIILTELEKHSKQIISKEKKELIEKIILLTGNPGIIYRDMNIQELQNIYLKLSTGKEFQKDYRKNVIINNLLSIMENSTSSFDIKSLKDILESKSSEELEYIYKNIYKDNKKNNKNYDIINKINCISSDIKPFKWIKGQVLNVWLKNPLNYEVNDIRKFFDNEVSLISNKITNSQSISTRQKPNNKDKSSIYESTDEWFLANDEYFSLQCNKLSNKRFQNGDILYCYDDNNKEYVFNVGYTIKKEMYYSDNYKFDENIYLEYKNNNKDNNKDKFYLLEKNLSYEDEKTNNELLKNKHNLFFIIQNNQIYESEKKFRLEFSYDLNIRIQSYLDRYIDDMSINISKNTIYNDLNKITNNKVPNYKNFDFVNKIIEELTINKNITNKQLFEKVSDITVYLFLGNWEEIQEQIDKKDSIETLIIKHYGDIPESDIFRKRIQKEYYIPSIIPNLSVDEKLPEVFLNEHISSEYKNFVSNIITEKIRDNVLLLGEQYYYNINNTEKKLVIPKLLYKNIKKLPQKYNLSSFENKDDIKNIEQTKLVFYIDNADNKKYVFNNDDIISQFNNNDFNNPISKKPFSTDFINRYYVKYKDNKSNKVYNYNIKELKNLFEKNIFEDTINNIKFKKSFIDYISGKNNSSDIYQILYNKYQCSNYNDLSEVPPENILYYKENDNIFCFDIIELINSFDNNNFINKYTNNKFSNYFIQEIRKKYSISNYNLESKNISTIPTYINKDIEEKNTNKYKNIIYDIYNQIDNMINIDIKENKIKENEIKENKIKENEIKVNKIKDNEIKENKIKDNEKPIPPSIPLQLPEPYVSIETDYGERPELPKTRPQTDYLDTKNQENKEEKEMAVMKFPYKESNSCLKCNKFCKNYYISTVIKNNKSNNNYEIVKFCDIDCMSNHNFKF